MTESVDVLVIGGGITGLSTAFLLQRNGLRVQLLSAEPRVGGSLQTIIERGFLFEAGATSVMPRGPEFLQLVDACGLRDQILLPSPRARTILLNRNGSLHPLPLDPLAFLRTTLFSRSAKFRLFREPFITRSSTDESVAEFFVRRFGQEIFDYGIEPLLPGTLAGQASRLSLRSTLPVLHALEQQYGSVTRGLLHGWLHGNASRPRTYARGFTFERGMETVTNGLAAALGSTCLTGARAIGVSVVRNHSVALPYTVSYDQDGSHRQVNAEAVVLAIPAYAASDLVTTLSPSTADVLRSIPYASLMTISFGFRRSDVGHPLNGFGYFLSAAERRHLLGCFWNSSQYRDRAPRDHVAISAFLGESNGLEIAKIPEDQAAELALSEISRTMQIQGKPVYLHSTRWARSIPQYEIGHERRMEQLRDFETEYPGIILAGSYRGGISVGARVAAAHRHTEIIIARLGQIRSMRQSSSPIQRSA